MIERLSVPVHRMSFQPVRQPARPFAQHRAGFINRFIRNADIGAYALCRNWRRGARLSPRRLEL
jgi:hypothetical protein